MVSIETFIFSPDTLIIALSVMNIALTGAIISKAPMPTSYDTNIYKDRLRRSTIQLMIVSILGLAFGAYAKWKNLYMSRWIMAILTGLMVAIASDMMYSFTTIGSDADVDAVKIPTILLLTFSILLFLYSMFIAIKYPTQDRFDSLVSSMDTDEMNSSSDYEPVSPSTTLPLPGYIMF